MMIMKWFIVDRMFNTKKVNINIPISKVAITSFVDEDHCRLLYKIAFISTCIDISALFCASKAGFIFWFLVSCCFLFSPISYHRCLCVVNWHFINISNA